MNPDNNNNQPNKKPKKVVKKPVTKKRTEIPSRKTRKDEKMKVSRTFKPRNTPVKPKTKVGGKGKEELSGSDSFSDSEPEVVPEIEPEPPVMEEAVPPVLNIEKIAQSIINKIAVIFCRVSSIGQTGFGHVSLEVQEAKGVACAVLFKLKIMSVIKIVESAYTLKKNKRSTIHSLIGKYSGKNIILYNVSRFSRNEAQGRELLDYALKRNTRLFFTEEGLIWDRHNLHNRQAILRKLMLAHEESRAIAARVSAALFLRKQQGFHTGGKPKYGYKVVEADGGKKAVPEQREQAVITFINMCREIGTSLRALNQWMETLADDPNGYEPLELGDNQRTIREPLSYQNIADLLNDYGITKRGSRWTAASVADIAKRDYENVLETLAGMTMKTGFQ